MPIFYIYREMDFYFKIHSQIKEKTKIRNERKKRNVYYLRLSIKNFMGP